MLRTSYWKKGVLLAFAAVLVVALAACGNKGSGGAPGSGKGKVIANYKTDSTADAKEGTVTDKEFDMYSAFFSLVQPGSEMYMSIPELKEQFLREYIGYKIMNARMGDKKPDKTETDNVNNFYTQFKSAMDSDSTMKDKVDSAGLKEADIKYFYSLITSVLNDEESKVTDDQVKAEYDKTKDDFNVDTVRHILVMTTDPQTGESKRTDEEALKRAQEVKKKLEEGGDWNALAKEYSDDPGSKDNGGLYEATQAKGWVEEFKNAANTQEIGKIGDPVQVSYGYHVIQVEKREPTAFDKLKDEDKEGLKQSVASENLNTFMTDELPKLITKVDLPTPSPSPSASPSPSDGADGASPSPDAGATNGGAASDSPDASASPDAGAANGAAK